MLQRENFPEIFNAVSNGRKPHSRLKLGQLRPLWDPRDKLVRVLGRMELAIRERNANPPILIPANHPVVDLLIRYEHIRLSHAGVKTTHSSLREIYWIIRGRQQTKLSYKRVLHKCVTCNRLQSAPPTAKPPPDLEESGIRKSNICLITCAYTRAIHLEPVRDLSAATFILALRRFFNATGGCQKM